MKTKKKTASDLDLAATRGLMQILGLPYFRAVDAATKTLLVGQEHRFIVAYTLKAAGFIAYALGSCAVCYLTNTNRFYLTVTDGGKVSDLPDPITVEVILSSHVSEADYSHIYPIIYAITRHLDLVYRYAALDEKERRANFDEIP